MTNTRSSRSRSGMWKKSNCRGRQARPASWRSFASRTESTDPTLPRRHSAVSPDDAALRRIVGGDFDVDLVAGKDADHPSAAHPAARTRRDLEAPFEFHEEGGGAQHLLHCSAHA